MSAEPEVLCRLGGAKRQREPRRGPYQHSLPPQPPNAPYVLIVQRSVSIVDGLAKGEHGGTEFGAEGLLRPVNEGESV